MIELAFLGELSL